MKAWASYDPHKPFCQDFLYKSWVSRSNQSIQKRGINLS
jgi:hypothetical protein